MGKTNLASLIKFSRDGEWGKSKPQNGYVEMAVIRGTDFDSVRNGQIDSVPTRYIKEHIAEYKALYGGEILLETAGGSKGRITGRSIYLKPEIVVRFKKPVTCASFSRFIKLKNLDSISKNYVFWLLQYLYHFGSMNKYHTQHTGVSRFQWTIFAENEMFDLPYIKTQDKIAAIFSAYDDLIENNLRRIKILEEMAQNLYREWFVNFRFPGHENTSFVDSPLGKIPEGWEAVKVGELLKSMRRVAKIPKGKYLRKGLYPIIDQGKDFIGGYTYEEEAVIKFELPTIIFGDHTRVLKFINFPFARGADGTQILKSNNNKMPMSLFYYALLAIDLSSYAYARHFKFLKEEMVIMPDKYTADSFNSFVEPILDLKNHLLIQVNQNLRQTRDLLLPKLISGEVDVSELDINVPEEVAT